MDFTPGQKDSGFIAGILGWLFDKATKFFFGTKAGTNAVDSPLITSLGLTATPSLMSAAKGKLAGYDYVLLSNASNRVMLVVTLPHNIGLHIIAIGDKSHSLDENIHTSQRKWLEVVSLEGDFPDRFEMYVSKDKQMEVRQLFEPDVMMNFYNLCRAYDFELFHESIYFSQADGAQDSNDTTSMVTDAEAFLTENKLFFDRLTATP
jgi:hypothetical protein